MMILLSVSVIVYTKYYAVIGLIYCIYNLVGYKSDGTLFVILSLALVLKVSSIFVARGPPEIKNCP